MHLPRVAALVLVSAIVPSSAIAAVPPATGSAAARAAVRSSVPAGATVRFEDVGCGNLAEVGERASCQGFFRVRRSGRSASYVMLGASSVRQRSAATVVARVAAVRRGRPVGGLPARLEGRATLTGRRRPTERTVHGALILDRGRRTTLSRDRWAAFRIPFAWSRAFGEGPVRLDGAFEHTYELPPGGFCTVQVGVDARVAASGPVERDGRLLGEDDEDGSPIDSRSSDGAGTTTWVLARAPGAAGSGVVRSGPAPRGAGPHALDTLVVTGFVDAELERYGAVTADGFPPPRSPTAEQTRDCDAAGTRAAARLVPRAVASTVISVRPRPPRADPEDEAPTPIERDRTSQPLDG